MKRRLREMCGLTEELKVITDEQEITEIFEEAQNKVFRGKRSKKIISQDWDIIKLIDKSDKEPKDVVDQFHSTIGKRLFNLKEFFHADEL